MSQLLKDLVGVAPVPALVSIKKQSPAPNPPDEWFDEAYMKESAKCPLKVLVALLLAFCSCE